MKQIKNKVNESELTELNRDNVMPGRFYAIFKSRVANAAHGMPGDIQKVVKEFFMQFKDRINRPDFTYKNLMELAESIEDEERVGQHGNPGFDRQSVADGWWSENRGKFLESKNVVRIDEDTLKNIIAENVKKALNEMFNRKKITDVNTK